MNDPIVEEVRRFRDEHARKFNYDLDAIFDPPSLFKLRRTGNAWGREKGVTSWSAFLRRDVFIPVSGGPVPGLPFRFR